MQQNASRYKISSNTDPLSDLEKIAGLGEALKEVPFGFQSVVNSEHPNDWAKGIQYVQQRKREVGLLESSLLHEKYLEWYSWEEHCKSLVIR